MREYVEIGLAYFRAGTLDAGMLLHGRPLGHRLAGGELLPRPGQRRLRGRKCRTGVGDARLGVVDFLAAHRAGAGEGLAAREVVLRFGEIRLGAGNLRFAQRDVGRPGGIRAVQRAHFAHGLREVRLRLRQCNFGVRTVEHHQWLALGNVVGVVAFHRQHRARDLRRDLYDVPGDVGVVGTLVVTQLQIPVATVADSSQHEDRACAEQPSTARAVARGRLPNRCRHRGSFVFGEKVQCAAPAIGAATATPGAGLA